MKRTKVKGALALAVSHAVTFGSIQAYAKAAVDDRPFTDEDLLILRLQVGRYILSDGVIGYRTGDQTCILLDDLVRGLEFAIDVDGDKAKGWFIKEENRFILDRTAGSVIIGKDIRPLKQGQIYDDQGDACVTLDAASRWFSLSFEIDHENASLNVHSAAPLPVEEREARKKRRAGIQQDAVTHVAAEKSVTPEYKWARWPVIDASVAAVTSNQSTQLNGDMLITSDAFKMSTELYASFDAKQGLETLRGQFGRRSAAGDLGGPLKLTEVVGGDVASPQNRLSASSKLGRGILLSSFDLDRPEIFDTTNLRGDLQSGWEVELYRNGVLLDFRMSRTDGRYEFLEIPVLYGRNEFRLVFYGPQGQIREEYEEVYVGESLRTPGENQFFLAVNQQDTALIYDRSQLPTDGQGALRFNGRYEHGITENLTIGVGASSYRLNGDRETFVDGSVKTSIGPVAVFADASFNIKGGSALAGSIQTSLAGISLSASHEEYFSYKSELTPGARDNLLTRRNEARAEFVLKPLRSVTVPIGASLKQETFESGASNTIASVRVSTAMGAVSASNEISANWVKQAGNEDARAVGAALLNYYTKHGVIRAEIGYNIAPELEVTRAAATMDIPYNERLGMRFDAGYDIQAKAGSFGAGINYKFDQVAVGAFGRLSTKGAYEAGISLTASFARDPHKRKWIASSKNTARNGVAAARAFIDTNGDGLMNDGDKLLQDTKFKVNSRPAQREQQTKHGAILTGLAVYEPSQIEIDMRTVEDPYLIGPKQNETAITLRPGVVSVIDIPLSPSGEIVGTTILAREEEWQAVGDVELELINTKGEIVAKTTSEFDGFYIFDRIPFGEYQVRIAATQQERLDLELTQSPTIELSYQNDVLEGVRLSIQSRTAHIDDNPDARMSKQSSLYSK